jgi:ubiquinone/menaquinone biosynthesis C-methylase UbiE
MPRPGRIRFLSRTAPFYDPVVRRLGFRRLWEAVAEWALENAGTPCLDVCTGTGGVAVTLAHRGGRAVGLDLAGGMLRHARRKARAGGVADRAQWVRMDARRIAFRDGSFPLVVCAMSLHEMGEEERGEVLGEIRRVASDRVLVADYRVPAAGWRRALFQVFRAFEHLESEDFEGYATVDVGDRLEEAGLVVEPPWDVALYRIWPCRVAPDEVPGRSTSPDA